MNNILFQGFGSNPIMNLGTIRTGGVNPSGPLAGAAIKQLMQTLRNPNSGPEQQQKILDILKSNPKLMAAFIKQRQVIF